MDTVELAQKMVSSGFKPALVDFGPEMGKYKALVFPEGRPIVPLERMDVLPQILEHIGYYIPEDQIRNVVDEMAVQLKGVVYVDGLPKYVEVINKIGIKALGGKPGQGKVDNL